MKTLTSLFTLLLLTTTALFALKPEKEYKVLPDEFGITYEKLTIPTKDNMHIAAWFFKAATESKKIVIISHSGDGNMSNMIEMASQFITLGYNVITYDYRGYGESSEFKINNNFYMYAQFEKDLNAVLDYTRKFYSKYRQVDLYGKGMGAGLSIGVGCNRPEVNKIIADSPYNTLESMQKRLKEVQNLDVIIPLAFDKFLIEPEYAVAERGKNVAGILLIWGEKDEICAQKDIRLLRKLAKCPTEDYKVIGATGENNFSINKAKYLEELKKFTK
ncbi:MAG: alpha/beta hydrolase [Bacteroidetes bacterium]|nr:alpha/beta hydrolase [Bacteroidota bacterium]